MIISPIPLSGPDEDDGDKCCSNLILFSGRSSLLGLWFSCCWLALRSNGAALVDRDNESNPLTVPWVKLIGAVAAAALSRGAEKPAGGGGRPRLVEGGADIAKPG